MTTLIPILLVAALASLVAARCRRAGGAHRARRRAGRRPRADAARSTSAPSVGAPARVAATGASSHRPRRSSVVALVLRARRSSATRRGRTSTSSASPSRRRCSATYLLLAACAIRSRRLRRSPRSSPPAWSCWRSGSTIGVDPLVPALQQPLLLTIHVGTAAWPMPWPGSPSWRPSRRSSSARRQTGSAALPSAAALRARRPSGRPDRVPDPDRRDRPRLGLGQPGVALVLEQRSRRSWPRPPRGSSSAPTSTSPRAVTGGSAGPLAHRPRLRGRPLHLRRRRAVPRRRAQYGQP